jgi:hypothetical protein
MLVATRPHIDGLQTSAIYADEVASDERKTATPVTGVHGSKAAEVHMKLGEILVKQGLLTEAQLASALTHQLARGARLGSYLIEHNILTTDQVALALAEQYGVAPALEADFLHGDPALRKRMVVHQAVELKAIPLFVTHRRHIAVAMAHPRRSIGWPSSSAPRSSRW